MEIYSNSMGRNEKTMFSERRNALGLRTLIGGHSRKWKLGISFAVRSEKRNIVVNFRCFVPRSCANSFHFRLQADSPTKKKKRKEKEKK